jgi:hypothetical protein
MIKTIRCEHSECGDYTNKHGIRGVEFDLWINTVEDSGVSIGLCEECTRALFTKILAWFLSTTFDTTLKQAVFQFGQQLRQSKDD